MSDDLYDAQQRTAQIFRGWYKAFIKVGFSPDEALDLILGMYHRGIKETEQEVQRASVQP
jgi:hypothetical protein